MGDKKSPGTDKKVAKTIKEYLWSILNAIIPRVGNGVSESINSRIKMIKIRRRGFRNKARYRNAIFLSRFPCTYPPKPR